LCLGLFNLLRQFIQPALGLLKILNPSSPKFQLTGQVQSPLATKAVVKSGLRSLPGSVTLPLLALQFLDAALGCFGLLARPVQSWCAISNGLAQVANLVNGPLQSLDESLSCLKRRLGLREDPPGLLLVPLVLTLGLDCLAGGSLLRFAGGESLAEIIDLLTELLDGCE